MNKKFLSIIMLVSAVSLRGMSAEYTQKMSDSTAKAQAALVRAQDRQDTLLNGLTAEQTKKACETAGTWALLGMTENGHSLPREDNDYDNYLQEALKTARGEGVQGTFTCGTNGQNREYQK